MNNLTKFRLTTLMTIVLLLFSSACLAKYPHITILSETAINVRYSDGNAEKLSGVQARLMLLTTQRLT